MVTWILLIYISGAYADNMATIEYSTQNKCNQAIATLKQLKVGTYYYCIKKD